MPGIPMSPDLAPPLLVLGAVRVGGAGHLSLSVSDEGLVAPLVLSRAGDPQRLRTGTTEAPLPLHRSPAEYLTVLTEPGGGAYRLTRRAVTVVQTGTLLVACILYYTVLYYIVHCTEYLSQNALSQLERHRDFRSTSDETVLKY